MRAAEGHTACLGIGLEQGSGEHVWLLECKADVIEPLHTGHSFWAEGGKAMVEDIIFHMLQFIAINKVIMCTN